MKKLVVDICWYNTMYLRIFSFRVFETSAKIPTVWSISVCPTAIKRRNFSEVEAYHLKKLQHKSLMQPKLLVPIVMRQKTPMDEQKISLWLEFAAMFTLHRKKHSCRKHAATASLNPWPEVLLIAHLHHLRINYVWWLHSVLLIIFLFLSLIYRLKPNVENCSSFIASHPPASCCTRRTGTLNWNLSKLCEKSGSFSIIIITGG